MKICLKTQPVLEPISIDILKIHLRLEHDREDNYLTHLIQTSRQQIEANTKRCLIAQKWAIEIKEGKEEIVLPHTPLLKIEEIAIKALRGEKRILNPQLFPITMKGDIAVLSNFIAISGPIRITYIAGYGDNAEDVPSPLKQAILMLAAYYYEHRGDRKMPLPSQIENLIAPFVVYKFS